MNYPIYFLFNFFVLFISIFSYLTVSSSFEMRSILLVFCITGLSVIFWKTKNLKARNLPHSSLSLFFAFLVAYTLAYWLLFSSWPILDATQNLYRQHGVLWVLSTLSFIYLFFLVFQTILFLLKRRVFKS